MNDWARSSELMAGNGQSGVVHHVTCYVRSGFGDI